VADPLNLFWDSCVFGAYLFEDSKDYLDSIEQFLTETKGTDPKWRIYTSSLVFTEILESRVVRKGLGSIGNLLDDFTGSIVLIDPTPPILLLAGRLKDIPYRKVDSKVRRLTTGDAIMLASALHVQDTLALPIECFHSFDDGGTPREIPILSFHEWCEGLTGAKAKLAARVCALRREKPNHPAPRMFKKEPAKG
jgi:hypothetical protein